MNILGIDPGSRLAGFACLQIANPKKAPITGYRVLDAGVIKLAPELDFAQKLYQLSKNVGELIRTLEVDVLAIEKAFTYLNPASGLKIGEVRGAILAQAASQSLTICEYTPKRVKKLTTGNGNATKLEVANAVKNLLKIKLNDAPFDVTDAIAIALSYAFENQSNNKTTNPLTSSLAHENLLD